MSADAPRRRALANADAGAPPPRVPKGCPARCARTMPCAEYQRDAMPCAPHGQRRRLRRLFDRNRRPSMCVCLVPPVSTFSTTEYPFAHLHEMDLLGVLRASRLLQVPACACACVRARARARSRIARLHRCGYRCAPQRLAQRIQRLLVVAVPADIGIGTECAALWPSIAAAVRTATPAALTTARPPVRPRWFALVFAFVRTRRFRLARTRRRKRRERPMPSPARPGARHGGPDADVGGGRA